MLEKLKLTCHSPQIKKTTSNKLCLSHLPCTICCTQATLKEKLPSFRGFLMVEHSEWKTKKCSYLVWCQHTSNRQNLSPSNDSLTYGDLLESLTELMRVLIIISIFFEAQQQQQQQLQQATATATTINLHKEHNNLVCLLMDFVIRDRFCCLLFHGSGGYPLSWKISRFFLGRPFTRHLSVFWEIQLVKISF